MTKTVNILLPNVALQFRAEALLVAIIIFVVADLIRVPASISMSLVGLLAGLSIANGVLTNSAYVAEVVAMWVAAPLIAIVFAFYLIRIINRRWPENIWRRLQTYKILLIVLAFSTSYVLGANTLGLIVATGGFDLTTVIAAIVAIFIGTFYLSAGEIRRVAQELFLMRYPNATATLVVSTVLVEVATVLNIPLSNTQALSAAVFGTGVSYKSKFVSLKPFLLIVLSWVIVPLLSFTIGLIVGSV
jgi:PiT family inorganic phosphate transporter